ncbi:MAG: YhbY family RNA-binding protein [Lachnospiraceae bacterium]|nr:YhbY family RNA-binding protein [Lachnospiraceae bacterium]
MTLTSKQRSYLKSLASKLEPAFSFGKSGLTPEMVTAIDEYFGKNELLKINVLKNCEDEPKELAIMVSERTRSTTVQVIGRKIVLYKPDRDKPKIILPEAGKKE